MTAKTCQKGQRLVRLRDPNSSLGQPLTRVVIDCAAESSNTSLGQSVSWPMDLRPPYPPTAQIVLSFEKFTAKFTGNTPYRPRVKTISMISSAVCARFLGTSTTSESEIQISPGAQGWLP